MFTRASSLLIALAMQASEAIQSPCSGPVSMKRKKSEKQCNAKRNKETMNKETMSKEEQMKHEYNELTDDIQSLAFVVSARRMLAVLWFALLVSSLRCLTGGVSLFEMLITSVILSLLADAVIGARFGTP